MLVENQNYYDEIYAYMSSFYPIPESSFSLMLDASFSKHISEGTILDDLGVVPNKIYMLNKGVMRSYIRLENGKEVTKSFFLPITILASFDALLNQSASESIYETLTDCDIFVLDYAKFKLLCEVDIHILGFYAKFLESLVCQKDKKNIDLLTLDGKGRYLKLRKMIPNIDNLIPQYQIAKYLSVTPVQLSRIRSKL